MKSKSFENLCLADRIKMAKELIDLLDSDQKKDREKTVMLVLKQEADTSTIYDALCDLDSVTDERLIDLENALCDITVLLEEGGVM